MKTNRNAGRVRTTVGDLIVSIMDAARRVTRNERRAYRLTGLVLDKMLQPFPVPATRSRNNFRKKNWQLRKRCLGPRAGAEVPIEE